MSGIEVTATVTTLARQRHAQQLVTGKSFQVVAFQAGSRGHDESDPLVALAPDPSVVELDGLVFGDEDVDGTGYLSTTCPYWTCVIERTEAVGAVISSLALVAEIVDNGTDPVDEVGTRFLYAVANMPRNPKTSNAKFTFTVGVQL